MVQRSGGPAGGGHTVLQVRVGPFPQAWSLTNALSPEGDAACRLTDRIEYAAPAGPVGAIGGGRAFRARAERFLAYGHAVLARDLALHARAKAGPVRIVVSGASGLIGRQLVAFLSAGGHTVLRLVRRQPAEGEIGWDPERGTLDSAGLDGCDAIVHLAGENIAGGRWTAARRKRIKESRQRGTALLAAAIARLERKPLALVSASAMGIYGSRGDELLTEQSAPAGRGWFLAEVCHEWEQATDPARAAGVRVAVPRFGVVLSPAGGALARLLPVFRLGLGGPVGTGNQWMSCVSLEDVLGAIHHALFTGLLDGPFNVVCPAPVTNAEFAATLGQVLGRPAIVPVPALALELVFGRMAEETILASLRVLPPRLLSAGYQFAHPTLESALRFELGRFAGL